jgi:hypothetical protein
MVNLQALRKFVLFRNHFTSSVPGNLGQDYNLASFDESTNLLFGLVPPHFCDRQQLIKLVFFNNMFLSMTLDVYGGCTTFACIWFEINKLLGPILNGLLGAPKMLILTTHNNMFNGSIQAHHCIYLKLKHI